MGEKQEEINDVVFEYSLLDSNGNTIFRVIETKAVLFRTNFIKEIEIPKDLEKGVYAISVKANYNGISRTASDTFEIIGLMKKISYWWNFFF